MEMINSQQAGLKFYGLPNFSTLPWHGTRDQLIGEFQHIYRELLNLSQSHWFVSDSDQVFLTRETGYPTLVTEHSSITDGVEKQRLAFIPSFTAKSFGDEGFKQTYGVKYAYYSGAMANGIASVNMVGTLGKNGMMGSFGSAGLSVERVEQAIREIQAALPNGPYAFNIINSPFEPELEVRLVELYLKYHVPVLEASAYMGLTYGLVYYRAAGLSEDTGGSVRIGNRIIAKISRKEVASRFMKPAPQDLLDRLVTDGRITPRQAELAKLVPMADDITVEADSGGHTDNRPLVGLIPAMLAVRDRIQEEQHYPTPVRIGAGGGISTPASALAAFEMGAVYIVTGSINQACVEAGVSAHTRQLLAQADMADVIMAPAADMFEMGVRVQVLKRGTMFAMRGSKLYELYSRYQSIEEIPQADREKIEKTIFRKSLDDVWLETAAFFQQRDPKELEKAHNDPHHKMALIFRWYLGLASRWSVTGEAGREMDYQVWCGPSMGTFNEWVKGTYLESMDNRKVVDVILHILTGAAYLKRLGIARTQGIRFPAEIERYLPKKPLI